MKVYHTDRVYRDDGIRDPMRWSRFGGLKFVAAGVVLVLIGILASASDPVSHTRGLGVDVASEVAATAVRIARARDAAAAR